MSDLGPLERAWAVLSPPRTSQYTSYPLDLQLGGAAVRVALDRQGFRHLLVPTAGEALVPDRRASILQIAVHDLQFAEGIRTYVDLFCNDHELHPEFDEVVEDVLDAVRETDRPGGETVRTVARWRRLFRSQLVRGMSFQARIGLFAELSVLSALLDHDPTFALECWTGPLRNPHDFEAPGRCLEVKGIGEDADGFVVHGLDQLATHDDRDLDLLVVTVASDPEGTSLDSLVTELRDRVKDRGEFRRRLAGYGWSDDQADQTSDTFSIATFVHVPVDDDAPRLVPRHLVGRSPMPGVSNVQYRLDLGEVLVHASGQTLSRVVEGALA